MYYLNNTHFSGASGPVAFAGADRTGIININQHIGNTSQTIGQFSPEVNRNLSERLVLDETMIRWLTSNGLRPSDGTLGEKQYRSCFLFLSKLGLRIDALKLLKFVVYHVAI